MHIIHIKITFEPPHDKTSKMAGAPSEDSDQPGHPPSLIRVFAVRMKKAWVLSYPLSAQRRLIRLGGCPGWSESSLGARQNVWFVTRRFILEIYDRAVLYHCACITWYSLSITDPLFSLKVLSGLPATFIVFSYSFFLVNIMLAILNVFFWGS